MRLKIFLFFSILAGLGSNVCWAQQSEFLYGKVIDAETKEPIPFATIRIQNKAIGVISNDDGGFSIPLKFKEIGEILEITSMGFGARKILISELASEQINLIMLLPKAIELQEVAVAAKKRRKLTAFEIVKKSIEAIPGNYPMNSFSTVGYYRDYQKKGNQYINLNEAILGVFDEGFNTPDNESTAVRIYDYRENSDFERDSIALKPYNYKNGLKVIDKAFLWNYGGNEFTILRIHDALRNYEIDSYSYVHRLKYDFIENHSFSREENTYLVDEPLYTISFGKQAPQNYARGVLYISQRDFSIYKMEYAVYDKSKTAKVINGNKNEPPGRLIFEVITEYQRIKNKMFLNYISFSNSFRLIELPKFKVEEIHIDFNKQCFVVLFNKVPERESAVITRFYSLKFMGKRINLREIKLEKKRAYLYPKFRSVAETSSFFKELNNYRNTDDLIDPKLFSFDVKKIIDEEGNEINSRTYGNFNQFREFFVQQVKLNVRGPTDYMYMQKDRPIFKNQPIVKPDDFYELWMNTPLKTTDN
jgi:hypothetical protein